MKKILIVDDSTSIRLVLEEILKEKYNVRTADDGHVAIIQLSQGFSPDLIVTDINMPAINGNELILFLKQSPLYQHIPIITISSFTHSVIADEEVSKLVDYKLTKPFNLDDLLKAINNVLNHQTVLI